MVDITAERMQTAVAELKRSLGLPEDVMLFVTVMARTVPECLRYSVSGGEVLFKDKDMAVAIYVRKPVNSLALIADCQIDITADNYTELPTEALRQEARKLLGLDMPDITDPRD